MLDHVSHEFEVDRSEAEDNYVVVGSLSHGQKFLELYYLLGRFLQLDTRLIDKCASKFCVQPELITCGWIL